MAARLSKASSPSLPSSSSMSDGLASPVPALSTHVRPSQISSDSSSPALNVSRPSTSDGPSTSAGPSGRSSILIRNRPQRREPGTDPLAAFGRLSEQQAARRNRGSTVNGTDRANAVWAEMQATLAEVEVSAERGTHFFGAEHAQALEELRNMQIGLAQAWARSDVEEEILQPSPMTKTATDAGAAKNTAANGATAVPPAASNDRGLDQDAEDDIALARKRREVNDRYFARISKGVLDVAERLEAVATAMGKVEKASREAWSESDSVGS